MPRFKCPKCGHEKIIMTGKVKRCSRCNEQFVPVETFEKKSKSPQLLACRCDSRRKMRQQAKQERGKKKKKSEILPSASGAEIERAEP